MGRWHSFRALPAQARIDALEAAAMLALASPLLRLVPFRHVARWLGDIDTAPVPDADPTVARAVGRAVERAARHLPWQPVCLPQALAARAMLRRRGIVSTLHFGMRRDGADRAMAAHAWVTAGAVPVVGVPAAEGFTVIARFRR
jgi:hypothetical protein